MKRLLILGCLCLAFPLRGQEASSTNAAALPRNGYRFLFLIDTSSAMSPQKTVTLDIVSRLILSGVGGRIRSGDAWNLWTIDDQVHTNAIPAQLWDPQQRADIANRMFRFLRDQPFNKKKALLEKALAAVTEEAKRSETLTVFLFTDGSKPVKGTPFDESIKEIFTKHGAGMRKAKKPFVTVFVAQDGRFVSHAVSPGNERIYIPPLPQAVAAAKKSEMTARDTAATTKALTAEEISEILRQSQKRQSNTVARTPAPLIIRGDTSNLVAVESPGKTATETPPRTPAAPASVPPFTTSTPPEPTFVPAPAPPVLQPTAPPLVAPAPVSLAPPPPPPPLPPPAPVSVTASAPQVAVRPLEQAPALPPLSS